MRLAVFFTYGVSLRDWVESGAIDRESAIYSQLLQRFEQVYFLTYGQHDRQYQALLPQGVIVLPKKAPIPNVMYSLLIPVFWAHYLREATWLKTNQLLGSWSAVITKLIFRKKLYFRSGYTPLQTRKEVAHPLTRCLLYLSGYFAYRLANISSVTSLHQQRYIERRYPFAKPIILPNGIDTVRFKPHPTPAARPNTLLFVGRLHSEKNIPLLLNAVAGIPGIHLHIVGRGPLEVYVHQRARTLGLSFTHTRRMPNNSLPALYNQATIYIQASRYEGNPKTILEAMACGLPVIATRVPGIDNLIEHQKTGWLCVEDAAMMKAAIQKLLTNETLRTDLGRNARAFIQKSYDLKRIVNQELSLYAT